MSRTRNEYIDFVKTFLIFLVILGHSIQMIKYKYESSFWDDPLFKFIYTFHMPLFIGISGYFSFYSIQKHKLSFFLRNRLIYLFTPMFLWCFFTFCLDTTISIFDVGSFMKIISLNYWFIWAIILFSFIISILHYFKSDHIVGLIISTLALMVIPLESFQYPLVQSMFPFFIVGYLLAQMKLDRVILVLRNYFILILVLSIICYFSWNKNVYPYITPSSFHYLKITVFRLFTSFIVSVCVLLILHFIYQKIKSFRSTKYICNIGRETLAIYFIQGMFFHLYVALFVFNDPLRYNNVFCFIFSIIFVSISYKFIKLIRKTHPIDAFLLGKS